MMAGIREHRRWRTVRDGLRRIRAGLGLATACALILGIEDATRMGLADRTMGFDGFLRLTLMGGVLYTVFGIITCAFVPPGARLLRWTAAAALGGAGGIAAAISPVETWIPEEMGGALDPGWPVPGVLLLLAGIALARFAGRVGECLGDPGLARGAGLWASIALGGLVAAILLRSLPLESAWLELVGFAAIAGAASWHLRLLRRAIRAIPEAPARSPATVGPLPAGTGG